MKTLISVHNIYVRLTKETNKIVCFLSKFWRANGHSSDRLHGLGDVRSSVKKYAIVLMAVAKFRLLKVECGWA